ncbi:ubiquitin-like protein 4A-B [Helicoverpa armigera]|uniref:ubiquitin-like protein 4A-B n=1 Tax=Helicoverpa armigera TaxID=29058 RepID=UPI003082B6CC
MKVIVKKLQGGECCLDVFPTTHIYEIKRQVAEQLNIPVEEQKLLLLGRTLVDEQTVESYPTIKDGTKLNLVVKKPDTLQEASAKYFKKMYGMTDAEAKAAGNRLVKLVQEKFSKLSWDDVDRLSLDCMLDENGQSRSPPMEIEPECDDVYSL